MIALPISQVVRFSEDEHRERLLWKLPEGRGGWFIDIDDDRATPILRVRSEVDDLLTEGLLTLSQDPWSMKGEFLSETQRLRCDEAWEASAPLLWRSRRSSTRGAGRRWFNSASRRRESRGRGSIACCAAGGGEA